MEDLRMNISSYGMSNTYVLLLLSNFLKIFCKKSQSLILCELISLEKSLFGITLFSKLIYQACISFWWKTICMNKLYRIVIFHYLFQILINANLIT